MFNAKQEEKAKIGMKAVATVVLNRVNATEGEYARISQGGNIRNNIYFEKIMPFYPKVQKCTKKRAYFWNLKQYAKKMFFDICNTDLHDNITFELKKICEIREGDKYKGYRVSISANYPPMAVPLKLDITTGG